jgi:hypothetical protein
MDGRLPLGPAAHALAFLAVPDVLRGALLGFGRAAVPPCLCRLTRPMLTVRAEGDNYRPGYCLTLAHALAEWAAVKRVVRLFGGGGGGGGGNVFYPLPSIRLRPGTHYLPRGIVEIRARHSGVRVEADAGAVVHGCVRIGTGAKNVVLRDLCVRNGNSDAQLEMTAPRSSPPSSFPPPPPLSSSSSSSFSSSSPPSFSSRMQCLSHTLFRRLAALRATPRRNQNDSNDYGDVSAAHAHECGIVVSGFHAQATLERCRVEGSRHGLLVCRGASVRLLYCTLLRNRRNGMRVSGSVTHVMATGCSFSHNRFNGAAVWNGGQCHLERGCKSKGNGFHGVQVSDACSACHITGCDMSGNTQCGLCVAKGAQASVLECAINNNLRMGLAVMPTGGHLSLMRGTKVHDNESGGVWAATNAACVELHRNSRVLGQIRAMRGALVNVVL